jgi:hypothetical protein
MENGSSTQRYSGVVELTGTELDQVAGGGKPGAGTGGSTAGFAITATFPISGSGGGATPDPDGGKGGISGPLN